MELRKSIKKLMIDCDITQKHLSEKLQIDEKSLSLALTGRRDGPVYISILDKCFWHLKDLKS